MSRPGFIVLLVLNCSVVAVGWLLLSLYREERAAASSLRTYLNQMREDLALERSQSADRDAALQHLSRLLTEVKKRQTAGDSLNKASAAQANGDSPADAAQETVLSRLSVLATRPDIDKIERMAPEEWEQLDSKWEHISVDAKRAGVQFESGVDVDTLLANPHWNPGGRELSLEERVELAVQLRNLRFFARTLPREDLHAIILPEAERRRALGDYTEYSGQPPPLPQGIVVSHGEATGVSGVSRMYYFNEESDPILYHHWHLQLEQELKAKITIFELINGSLPTTRGG